MLCLCHSKMFLFLPKVEILREFFSEEILNFWKFSNKKKL